MAEGSKFRGLVAVIPAILSGILELAGIGAIIAGFWLISPIAGVFAAGVGAILLGLFIKPPRRPVVTPPREEPDE